MLGLEIGDKNIKFIQLIKKGDYLEVKHALMLPTPDASVQDGEIKQIEPVYKLLKETLSSYPIYSKKIGVIIQSSRTITRDLTIEGENKKHVKELMKVQYESYLPIDLSEYEVDCRVFESLNGQSYKVICAAVPKDIINPILCLLQRLKLRPCSIDIPLDALAYLFQNHIKERQMNTQLVIDIGDQGSNLLIIENGMGVLNKHLYDMEDDIEGVVKSIKQFIQFYHARPERREIESIYMLGKDTKLKELQVYVKDLVELPVYQIRSLKNIVSYKEANYRKNSFCFSNLIGLASGLLGGK